MPRWCIFGCTNRLEKSIVNNLSFHLFPNRDKFPETFKEWEKKISSTGFSPNRNSRICSVHFTEDDFDKSCFLKSSLLGTKLRRVLKPGAVPSLLLNDSDLPFSFAKRKTKVAKRKTKEIEYAVEDVLPAVSENKIREEHTEENKIISPSKPENTIWFTIKDEHLDIKTEFNENIEHSYDNHSLENHVEYDKNYQPVKEELILSTSCACILGNGSLVAHNVVEENININKNIDKDVENIIVNKTLLVENVKNEPENFESTEFIDETEIDIKEHDIGLLTGYSTQECTSFHDNNVASCSYASVAGDKESSSFLFEDDPAMKCEEKNSENIENYLNIFGNPDKSVNRIKRECKECQKVFSQSRYLKRHVERVHLGTKRHKCSQCQKIFAEACYLRVHISTVHQGIKNFECSKCQKKFSHYHNLCRHDETVHKNIKKFNCAECLKRFSEVRSVRRHIERKHKGNMNS